MTQYLIMCRSLTYAQRAAQALERAGYRAAVVRAPQELRGNGCGYALSMRRGFEEAVKLLQNQNLLSGKLYQKQNDSEYREVFP